MTFSLYDAIIPGNQQIVGSVIGLIEKAEAHCAETDGCTEEDLVQAKLAEDMLPLGFQVKWVTTHSMGAIEGVRQGRFSPDVAPPPATLADLKSGLARTRDELAALTAAEVNGFVGKDMVFAFNEMEIPFTAENFLLSFSQPNFYFHATTAYDILRHRGVKLGKRDFLGQMRVKAG